MKTPSLLFFSSLTLFPVFVAVSVLGRLAGSMLADGGPRFSCRTSGRIWLSGFRTFSVADLFPVSGSALGAGLGTGVLDVGLLSAFIEGPVLGVGNNSPAPLTRRIFVFGVEGLLLGFLMEDVARGDFSGTKEIMINQQNS